MDSKAIEASIRKILTAPGVDLATISSKRVRKELGGQFGDTLIKENKEAIDALIIEAFNEIATAAGATQDDASREPQSEVKQESVQPTIQPQPHVQTLAPTASPAVNAPNGIPPSKKRDSPDSASEEDDEDDGSSSEESEAEYGKKRHASTKAKPPASPAKRRLLDEAAIPPQSSPNVPLSMASGLTDEEYAKQLQRELNAAAAGRATRGGGYQKRAATKGKKGSSTKGARGKKVKSKAYISDSDLEGEERPARDEDDDDDDDDADGDEHVKPAKKRKRTGGTGGGTGGGYNKELALAEPLQRVCGAPTMSRPQIVKHLWEYIRQNGLQNPEKKSDIINDDLFKEIFGVEKMTMFSMNKYLKKSVFPIEG